ncbi:MAG: histidine triad nucleotide-binding protein [Sporomusaceae bacterium]|jgi:histidine triad (HIT) family protein|nr:histidine triad nucleotide-binding protein [Sporomusaceae bacterium]
MNQDCIFCKIAAKSIPANAVYEDEHVIAFPDLNPVAPVHILLIPKKHITSLLAITEDDQALLGHILSIIPTIAAKTALSKDGFRLVANTGENGGQTVNHLHFHLLGGRKLSWPPG